MRLGKNSPVNNQYLNFHQIISTWTRTKSYSACTQQYPDYPTTALNSVTQISNPPI